MFSNIPSETVVAIGSIVLVLASIIMASIASRLKTDLGDALDRLKSQSNWPTIVAIAKMAVRAAQQAKLNGWIEATGHAAKAEALRIAQQWLNQQGLEEIDVNAFANLIEAAYNELKGELKDHLPEVFDNVSGPPEIGQAKDVPAH